MIEIGKCLYVQTVSDVKLGVVDRRNSYKTDPLFCVIIQMLSTDLWKKGDVELDGTMGRVDLAISPVRLKSPE